MSFFQENEKNSFVSSPFAEVMTQKKVIPVMPGSKKKGRS